MRKLIILLLSSAFVIIPISFADQHDTGETSVETGAEAEEASFEESLSLNFRNVDINQFIESISVITGRNFLVDPRVTGRITIIASQPVPQSSLYDVMLSVLQFYGFTAITDGDITRIVPFAEGQTHTTTEIDIEEHGYRTEIIKLNNIGSAEVIAVLRPLLTRQAVINVIPKGNDIIISDTEQSIERVKEVIARLDRLEVSDYEIISLQNAEAASIIATVNALFGAENQGFVINMQPDARTNRIILSGTRDVRDKVKALISSLDVPLSTNANIKVIYLRYAEAQNIANILGRLTSSDAFRALATQGEGGVSAPAPAPAVPQPTPTPIAPTAEGAVNLEGSNIQADTSLNALIISGSPNFISAVESIVRQLDVQRAQIIIEVVIAELTDDFTRQLGVDWVYRASGFTNFATNLGGTLGNIATTATGIASGVGAVSGGLFGAAYFGTINDGWGALVNALNQDTRSNIVATPYIVTLDNEEASFSVGENRPFVTGTVTGGTGTNQQITRTVERRNVGINLVITPQVTAGDTVRLAINQEISNVLPGESSELGITTTERSISTNVQVKDGGLIILGGLLSDEQTERTNKVPVLGDIPFLGYLFRNQSSDVDKTNIMIFMRPRILTDESAIAGLSHAKYNALRQNQLAFPQYNSLIAKGRFPRLRDIRDMSLFTDYGRPRSLESIIETDDQN